MYSISLVIPIYNEQDNIYNLFNEILDTKAYELFNEIIFIDDCSTDDSLKYLNSLKDKHSKIDIIKNDKNYGQSKCIYLAIKHSKSKIIITMDGDGQNNPNDINKLLDLYLSKKLIYLVGGIRKNRKDSMIKIISSKLANFIRKSVLHDNCDDTGCSLKVFDRETFIKFPYFDGIHRFLPALYSGYGKKTQFVDVDHRPRKFGQSKYGTFLRLINGIIDIFRVLIIIRRFKNDI